MDNFNGVIKIQRLDRERRVTLRETATFVAA